MADAGEHEYSSKKLRHKCTYGDCSKRFETEKDMKRHKVDEPEHDYCKKCDIDCTDWEDFVRHKVDAMWPWLDGRMKGSKDEQPKHIVCEFCGADFKSFGGRKLHRDQNHQRDQNIVCPGCQGKFTRAGNYVEHLENGRCETSNPITGITTRELKESIQQKHIVEEIKKDPGKFQEGFHGNEVPALPYDLVSESEPEEREQKEDGGVLIMNRDNDEQRGGQLPLEAAKATTYQNNQVYKLLQSRAQQETWPRLPGLPAPWIDAAMGSLSIDSPALSISASDKSASQFASDITSRRGSTKVQTATDPSSPVPVPSDIDFSDTASNATPKAINFPKTSTPWTGNTSQIIFKDAKLTPAPGDFDGWKNHNQGGKNMLQPGRFWDRYSSDYKVPECYNAMTGLYECPIADCKMGYEYNAKGYEDSKTGYKNIEDLEGHLINAHVKTKERCPLCLKIFQTAHAFISHAESGGRCKIKDTSYFDKFLNEITGGFLQAEQVHQPKVYKTSSTVAKGDQVVDGVMSTRFEAALPDDY